MLKFHCNIVFKRPSFVSGMGKPVHSHDSSFCEGENRNEYDKNAVAIYNLTAKSIIGHGRLSEVLNKFLSLPHSSIKCKVAGKRINRGVGYSLEVPMFHIFYGDLLIFLSS